MKRIINILITTAALLVMNSCNKIEVMEIAGHSNDEIVLEFSSALTKAADTSIESYLNHVDVMIFEYGGNDPGALVTHERIELRGTGKAILRARRSDFTAGKEYYVQIVANSTSEASVFAGIGNYDALLNMKQEDANIHISGEEHSPAAPDYFLMDGTAYSSADEPDAPSGVVLNNGVAADDTELKVTLRRAAAKVFVNITFDNTDNAVPYSFTSALSSHAVYHVRNLPVETFILDQAPSINTKLSTTDNTSNSFFTYPVAGAGASVITTTNVQVTAYVYAHDWDGQSAISHVPCIIVNLPLTNGVDTPLENNWYKIPMSADHKFDRNMYYEVDVRIKRPGASSVSSSETVEEISYNVADWDIVNINVGNNSRPDYLYVNLDNLTMSNIETDATSIEFASSADVTITMGEVWYTDKFGIRQTVSNSGIKIAPDPGLNGKIEVYSPLPTNNTVRNFSFTVHNGSLSHTINVVQYPLEYITNTLSWYSYRSDFLSTAGDPTGLSTGKHYENRSQYSRFGAIHRNGTSSYGTSNAFFRSKFVAGTYGTTHQYKGLSNVDSYTNNNTANFNDPYNARIYHIRIMASSGKYIIGRPKITDGVTDPGADNALLVSPSFMIASRLGTLTTDNIDVEPDYSSIGVPSPPVRPTEPNRSDYGASWFLGWYWPSGSDEAGYNAAMDQYNKDLAVYNAAMEEYDNATAEAIEQATVNAYIKLYAEHCKQYVEVYDPDNNPDTDNAIHYNDWRLPTKAELEIIYRFQGEEGDTDVAAIDYLLNAGAYYSASGPVTNPSNNMTGQSVRCIRDAY